MTEDKIVSIPLMKFSTTAPPWPWEESGAPWASFLTISVKGQEHAEGCYGVEMEDDSMSPLLKPGMVAIFSQSDSAPAFKNIYSIGRKGDVPLVRKVVKNEIPASEKNAVSPESLRPKRKSFMAPTPLHIPGSLVSPIAESTHETIYLKGLVEQDQMILVPKGNLLWMHPLVLVLKEGEG